MSLVVLIEQLLLSTSEWKRKSECRKGTEPMEMTGIIKIILNRRLTKEAQVLTTTRTKTGSCFSQ